MDPTLFLMRNLTKNLSDQALSEEGLRSGYSFLVPMYLITCHLIIIF